MKRILNLLLGLFLLQILACTKGHEDTGDTIDWSSHGGDAFERRYSPLTSIDRHTVSRLGLAWEQDADASRGLEATPIVVDGVMYTTTTWSRVMALDAATGEVLWRFDPKVPRAWARRLCCDVVNRGVAVSDGRVFVGTLDGRLFALNSEDGSVHWEVDTLTDRDKWYSITGAPRVVRNKVIIGNGGAEFSVRGYVSAYDLADGQLQWRFFTVPGNANGPFEHEELSLAASTWDPASNWTGAGGTVWDSMAYDPALDLLYVGTGNGSPWQRGDRSPSGGDNLFLSSILALRPDDGELVWHYQTTPGENWDFTATQHMILADMEIEGRLRKVLMQAPKNGFFYVLDRASGELISAEKYVFVNWASHVDLTTGRPVETQYADYESSDKYVFPSPAGGHNWHPMTYNPETGLVYFSARDIGWVFSKTEDKWFTYGADNVETLSEGQDIPETRGYLKAWNPVTQKLAWQQVLPNIWNGGVLSTAGSLVFHGTATGDFYALDAANGEILKHLKTGTGIIAPPITYSVDGEQFIAVMAGWGGPAFNTLSGTEALLRYGNAGRILAFKLDGKPVRLPDEIPARGDFPEPPGIEADAATIEKGRLLYVYNCGSCHGLYGSEPMLPDLRRMSAATHKIFSDIVLDGVYEGKGMAGFSDSLTDDDVFAIHAYIVELSRAAVSNH